MHGFSPGSFHLQNHAGVNVYVNTWAGNSSRVNPEIVPLWDQHQHNRDFNK